MNVVEALKKKKRVCKVLATGECYGIIEGKAWNGSRVVLGDVESPAKLGTDSYTKIAVYKLSSSAADDLTDILGDSDGNPIYICPHFDEYKRIEDFSSYETE